MSNKPGDTSEMLRELSMAMMNIKEISAPIEEAARGMRWDLLKQHGWTEASADQMACEWYTLVMKNMQAAAIGKVTGEDSPGNVG